MTNVMWEMSKRLVSEQRYLALKDSQKFQQRMGSSSKQGARYIQRLILTTYLFTSIMMVFFSFFLVTADYKVNNPLEHLQSISFIIYAYIFLFSLYSVIMFINIVKNYKLFDPLKALPSNVGHQILPLSWFIYNGSSSLFVIVPLIYEYAARSGNYYLIPMGVLWAFITMAMGYISGVLIVTFMSARGSSNRKGRLGAFSNIVRLLGLIVIFVLFEIALQEPGNLPAFPPVSTFPFILLIPLINVSYISFPTIVNFNISLLGLGISSFYAVAMAFIFLKFNKRIFTRISEQESISYFRAQERVRKIPAMGLYRNTFSKDIRNIFRKPQNATMVLIPIIFVTPTLFQLFFYSSTVSFGSISIYYSLLSIVIVSSSFYSIVLIISEGNGISVLQSLPLRMREIVYSKNIVGTTIFSIIVTPIALLFLFKESSQIITLFLLPINLIVAFVYTSLFNIRRLLKRVPRGSTTVNFYSFGGNVAFFTLFIITLIFTAIPTVIATLISYLVVMTPFTHPDAFYLSVLALNLGALFIVMNLVNRST